MRYFGVTVIRTEESYTSKCDALALEGIYKQIKYSGKRTRRGMFVSSTGKSINADINGALNILRKYLIKNNIDITSYIKAMNDNMVNIEQPVSIKRWNKKK